MTLLALFVRQLVSNVVGVAYFSLHEPREIFGQPVDKP